MISRSFIWVVSIVVALSAAQVHADPTSSLVARQPRLVFVSDRPHPVSGRGGSLVVGPPQYEQQFREANMFRQALARAGDDTDLNTLVASMFKCDWPRPSQACAHTAVLPADAGLTSGWVDEQLDRNGSSHGMLVRIFTFLQESGAQMIAEVVPIRSGEDIPVLVPRRARYYYPLPRNVAQQMKRQRSADRLNWAIENYWAKKENPAISVAVREAANQLPTMIDWLEDYSILERNPSRWNALPKLDPARDLGEQGCDQFSCGGRVVFRDEKFVWIEMYKFGTPLMAIHRFAQVPPSAPPSHPR